MTHETQELLEFMTRPGARLVADMKKLDGDIMILGAGGKIGPSMAITAKRAADAAGTGARVFAASLFDGEEAPEAMRRAGVEVIAADLSDPAQLAALPDAKNVIFMAGRKFGTVGRESATWQTNVILPYLAAERYAGSRFVAFSTGNVYGMAPVVSGGFCEDDVLRPIGEYAQSCLGRERILEHCSEKNRTPMLIFRLNYAIDLRYGVLYDIAKAIMDERPIDVSQGVFNCIWQGDVCEYAIRSLLRTAVPPEKLNVSSPEALSIRWAAKELGKRLGKEPRFTGEEVNSALFSNCQKLVRTMGAPTVGILSMMDMVADWILRGGEAISAPTHFETTNGVY